MLLRMGSCQLGDLKASTPLALSRRSTVWCPLSRAYLHIIVYVQVRLKNSGADDTKMQKSITVIRSTVDGSSRIV